MCTKIAPRIFAGFAIIPITYFSRDIYTVCFTRDKFVDPRDFANFLNFSRVTGNDTLLRSRLSRNSIRMFIVPAQSYRPIAKQKRPRVDKTPTFVKRDIIVSSFDLAENTVCCPVCNPFPRDSHNS